MDHARHHSPFRFSRSTNVSSGIGRISCPKRAKPRFSQGPFSGLCCPTSASRRIRQVRHPRSQWCSSQQVGPWAGNRRTWRSKRVDLPVTLEGRYMSSLLWEAIFSPRLSPTCRSNSHLSFATGSMEPFSASSPRFRYSTSRYLTHCVCQCWSTRRILFAYHFLFLHLWRC